MPHDPLLRERRDLAPNDGAPQHEARPRPLPLFLHMLRSEAGEEPERMAAVLAGVRRYQRATRSRFAPAAREIARAGRARLMDYGGRGPPVVFVPSLINGPEILDLDEKRSLLRWLAGERLRPLIVDWGHPTAAECAMTIGDHVEQLLLPLLDAVGEPPILVGYCLGGTIALGAAACRRPRALGLIAAPWDYAGFPDTARTALAELWNASKVQAEALGLLPMEVLQTAFWRLDPARTLAKFESLGRSADRRAEAAFVTVEDWANGGPPLTFAAARELMEHFFAANATGGGAWRIGGKAIDPKALDIPILEIVSTTDRIVPAAAAAGIGRRLPLALGHVGMIVGGRARKGVWQPLAEWLRSC